MLAPERAQDVGRAGAAAADGAQVDAAACLSGDIAPGDGAERNDAMTSAMPANGPGTLSPFVPPAEAHPDRRAGEPERLAQLVLQIAPVREVDLLGIVQKKMNVGGDTSACVA